MTGAESCCRSVVTGGGGCSGPTITPSLTKTFSDQTNTTAWGTTSSVNLNLMEK